MLERARAGRCLGPVVVVVLVFLVLLIGLHPVSDEFVEHAALICAAIALAGLIVIPLVGGKPSRLPKHPARKRSPPHAKFRTPGLCLADSQSSFPLRR